MNDTSEKKTIEDEDKSQWYGWGVVKPRFLQSINKLAVYVPLAVIMQFTLGFVSGWIGTGLQEIEKQFRLTSTVSSTLATASDLGNTCSVVFIGYIGTKFNKAKSLSVGLFVFGLAFILNALPHFLLEPYSPPELASNSTQGQESDICPTSLGLSNQSITGVDNGGGGGTLKYFSLLLVGQVLAGIGSAPIMPLGLSFVDSNTSMASSAIIVGLLSTTMALGGALSAMVGGLIIQHVYVDFDRVDMSKLSLKSGDPHWIGAWWLGFFVCGFIFILLALPISGFPNKFPNSPKKEEEEDEAKTEPAKNVLVFLKNVVTDFFKSFFKLILDPEFVCINISSSVIGVALAGMSMFVFKFVTNEYDLSYETTGYILGTKAVVGSFGFVVAGLLVKVFKLDLFGMEKVSTIMFFLAVLFGCGLFAACPNTKMPGVELPYPGDSAVTGLVSGCQGQCQCQGQQYNPICGGDGLVYYSPCHAGCQNTSDSEGVKSYSNCQCIAASLNVSVTDKIASASSGLCKVECWEMYFVLACLFCVGILIVMCNTFSSLTILRCVDQQLQPFALALNMIFMRILGTIPAPPVIGAIIDAACELWSGNEEDTGRFCQLYDKKRLTTGIAFMWMGSGILSCMFMFFAALINIYKRRSKKNFKQDKDLSEKGDDCKLDVLYENALSS